MEKPFLSFSKQIKKEMIIAGVIFALWMVFFNEHNLIQHYRNRQKLERLTEQQDFLKNKILTDRQKIRELRTNQENLEKFAREQFLMKKENEDVFIVLKK